MALMLFVQGPAAAGELCARRPYDPRSGSLEFLEIEVTGEGIAGKVKNRSSDAALGVRVWVNYYITRRGGLSAQQCIPIGDLKSGEERGFHDSLIPEAERAEAYDYTVDALEWR
ncbi:MAG: hypothetical protein ACREKA_05160 [Candidatus Methylomirabilales bacterium]